jgi:hypothetical protein
MVFQAPLLLAVGSPVNIQCRLSNHRSVADLRWYPPPVVRSLAAFFLAEMVFQAPLLLAVGSPVNIQCRPSSLRSVADLRWYFPPVLRSLAAFFLAEVVFHARLLPAVGSPVNVDQAIFLLLMTYAGIRLQVFGPVSVIRPVLSVKY